MIGATTLSAIFILRIIVTECFYESRPIVCREEKFACHTTLYFNTTNYSELVTKTAFLNESRCVETSLLECEKLLKGTILQVDCSCATDLCNDVNQSAWNKKFSDLLDDFLETTAKTRTTIATKTAKSSTIPARSTTTGKAHQQTAKTTTTAETKTAKRATIPAGSTTTGTALQQQKMKYSKSPRAISTATVFTTVKYVFGEPENNCPVKVFWLRVSFGICGFCFVYVLVCWIRNVVINHRYQQNHEKKKAERKRLEEQRRAEKENAPPEERPFRRRKRLLTDLDKQVLKAKKAKWSTFEELLGILDTEMEKLRKPESESAKEPNTEEIPQKPKGKPVEAGPFVEKEDETQKSSVTE